MTTESNLDKVYLKRLKKKFKHSLLEEFQDQEILEVFLGCLCYQKNVCALSKRLLKKFGGIRGVLDASVEEICSIKDIKEDSAICIKLLKETAGIYLQQKL